MEIVTHSRDDKLRQWLAEKACEHGFDTVRITTAAASGDQSDNLASYLAKGYHGTMGWMADTAERRSDPRVLWPQVKSVIVFAMNYGPDRNPLKILGKKSRGAISVYAQNRDYHDIIKGRLKTIAGQLAAKTASEVKVFVDTAPVMEKPLAAAAGIGWQGKHTNLVSRQHGSWLFLGSIFTTASIGPDRSEIDHCGSCRACLDICPTDAFPAPYKIDARRCISYLTIEHKGQIPHQFRIAMGNRIYGCDDCLAVCPWNKFAATASEVKLKAREDLREPELADLLLLDDPSFRRLFSGSPIKRIGRDRFVRNCLIAAGNSGDDSLIGSCKLLLGDTSPLVRGAAVWALGRLAGHSKFEALRAQYQRGETDEEVLAEWKMSAESISRPNEVAL
ncbi:MAG: tRNA epoxyqueuosine(34) reductase QueG [Rhizobiaceae bacterium]